MREEQVVDLIRRVRHDFGNSLQIINGYLELGRPEESGKYISGLIQRLSEERRIFDKCDAACALFLYQTVLNSLEKGIILKYEKLDFISGEMLAACGEPERSLERLKIDPPSKWDEVVINLSLTEKDQEIIMVFSGEFLEDSPVTVKVKY